MKPAANKLAGCAAVAAFPQGTGVDAIGAALPHIPHRTLQRLIGELVDSGQLIRTGKARATLYALAAVRESPWHTSAHDWKVIRPTWTNTLAVCCAVSATPA